ncbi:8523_t:CDS:2 [Ambispora gerdemannii]|uniref:8523_t:CDS:1 n=1 Tax=Ambispora gerdemannii TaxID=144530 RepID=A0A9N8YYU1_9GLOM|nr:8523_t:CDS:2 [Ambispora gerdemannii]
MDELFDFDKKPIDGGFGNIPEGSLLKEANKVPLFMTELPEEENDTLAALQSLLYDGTPEEVAENFKNQGNECFKAGKTKYQDAIAFYSKAIDTTCKDEKIIEACLTNRAAVNLELQNYRKVLMDCAKALKINPKNVKALFRSAKALYMLDKIDQALDCCNLGLEIEPKNKYFQLEKQKCIRQKEYLNKKKREKEARARQELERKKALENAIKERNIQMETTSDAPDSQNSVFLDTEAQQLVWPVFLLYPEYKESDFIAQFNEEHTFLDHLEMIFEHCAPWDMESKYTPKNVDIYFESVSQEFGAKPTLIKVGRKIPLKEVLSHRKYVVRNGIPSFIILPKNAPFTESFLKKYK